jgi:hypothetical protein
LSKREGGGCYVTRQRARCGGWSTRTDDDTHAFYSEYDELNSRPPIYNYSEHLCERQLLVILSPSRSASQLADLVWTTPPPFISHKVLIFFPCFLLQSKKPSSAVQLAHGLPWQYVLLTIWGSIPSTLPHSCAPELKHSHCWQFNHLCHEPYLSHSLYMIPCSICGSPHGMQCHLLCQEYIGYECAVGGNSKS